MNMDDANLEKLVIKPGKLKPKFNQNITEYEIVINSGVKQLKIDPMTRDCNASWTILGTGTERAIPIIEGVSFTLVIEVTAEDGTTKKYSINVVCLSASNAVLSSISIMDFTITPEFNPKALEYDCTVPFNCGCVTVQALSPDKSTKIEISNNVDGVVHLNVGASNITVCVTSPDGKNSISYNIIVQRQKFLIPLTIPNYNCAICQSMLHCPVSIGDETTSALFCRGCLQCVTRTNKNHPFTNQKVTGQFYSLRYDIEEKLGQVQLKCPLQCEKQVLVKDLGVHLKSGCSAGFSYEEKVDAVIHGILKEDDRQKNTETCSSCSRPVPVVDKDFHMKNLCSSKHTYKIDGKVVSHKWEERYQQEVCAQQIDDAVKVALEFENEYFQLVAHGQSSYETAVAALHKTPPLYAHAISLDAKNHVAHYRLAIVLEELHHAQEFLGVQIKESKSTSNIVDQDDEFQSADSMEDDIKALAEQKGFGKDASATNQLKALDQEYHFLLEQGQSQKADYVQKLYAFKQKQHNQGNTIVVQSTETLLGKAYMKYLDAATVEPRNAVYQMHIGRALILQQKYKDALVRLKYAVALKPAFAEAKFYLAYVLLKCNEQCSDVIMRYMEQSICTFIYHVQWKGQCKNKHFAEKFADVGNFLFIEGLYEYVKFINEKEEKTCLFMKSELLTFISMLCFKSMHGLVIRFGIFKHLQMTALQVLLDYGNNYLAKGETDAGKLKKYYQNLSSLTMNFSSDANVHVLNVQRKICEATVLLSPCSSKALNHLGEVLWTLADLHPAAVKLADVEKYFRASMQHEEKDMNAEEISSFLLETEFWKNKEKLNSETKPVNKKDLDQNESKVAAKAVDVNGRGRGAVKASQKGYVKPATNKVPLNPKAGPSATVAKPTTKSTSSATKISAAGAKSGPSSKAPAPGPVTTSRAKGSQKTSTTKAVSKSSSKSSDHKCASHDKDRSKLTPAKKSPVTANKQADEPDKKLAKSLTLPVEINEKSYRPRIGLARAMLRHGNQEQSDEIEKLYREVLEMAPSLHDGYIEFGELLVKSKPLDAVNVYCRFPFSDEFSYDDAYLYGEIVRLLMKCEKYDDPRLKKFMIAQGKVLGFSSLEKYITILENKHKYNKMLCEMYAAINNKNIDDSGVQAFFKFKLWI